MESIAPPTSPPPSPPSSPLPRSSICLIFSGRLWKNIVGLINPQNTRPDFFIIIYFNTLSKAFGEYFGVEIEAPSDSSKFKVEDYMKDKKLVWEAYVKKHGGDVALFDYATWDFAGNPPSPLLLLSL